MRKRNIELKIRLNQKEASMLDNHVRLSGLTREAYLRQLILGYVPKPSPPPDFHKFMEEMHQVGNTLTAIALRAHEQNIIDTNKYDQEVAAFRIAVKSILDAVLLPDKIKED